MTDLVKKESKIAPWGDRSDVREIAQRVQMMAPGAKKLSENEALALAQGAIAHELDPFNGEIWYIPGSGLMAGIKGLRKAARKQLKEGETFWVEFEPILDPDKRKLYMIPEGALAFEAQLRDTPTLLTYSNAWKELADSGIPVDVIPRVVGKQPFTLGIGIFEKDERTKMKPVQAAMKRAEADAIKRRFDLPFATPSQEEEVIIEGEWTMEEVAPVDEEELKKNTDVLYDTETESVAVPREAVKSQSKPREKKTGPDTPLRVPNQWESEITQAALELKVVQAIPHAVNILNKSPFYETVPYGELETIDGLAFICAWQALKRELPEESSDFREKSLAGSWQDEAVREKWRGQAADLLAEK